MFIHRRRAEFGLLEDPSETISDTELISLVQEIKADSPYYGITMIWGCVRSRGIKVTRERLRRALKSIDPLGGALRWPSQIRRRPYSVGGPNSLWHIGKSMWHTHTHTHTHIHTMCIMHLYRCPYVICNKSKGLFLTCRKSEEYPLLAREGTVPLCV